MHSTDLGHGEQPGILITKVRPYNALVAVMFGGRRGAVNAALARRSGARPGDRVLDIGSGPGKLAKRLAAAVGREGQVTGVDPSEPMIAYARRHAPDCRFVLAPAQSIAEPDASFDVVTSTFVMHHIPEEHRETAIGHAYRVLRPGGRLLIADIHPTGRFWPAVIRFFARHHGDVFAETSLRQYEGMLRAAGFSELSFGVAGPWTGYLTAVKPA